MERFIKRLVHSNIFRIVAGFALACSLLAAMGWLAVGPYRSMLQPFDSSIRSAMREFQSPLWTSLFLTVTKLGSTVYLTIVGCVAGIVFIYLRRFRPLLLFIVVMAGQAALHHGFKYFVARPRPSSLLQYRVDESFSFPSGHALSALCLYASLAWLISNRTETSALKAGIWITAPILILLIGVSRIYIGIHHSSDVIAGFIAAAVWTAAVISCDKTDR